MEQTTTELSAQPSLVYPTIAESWGVLGWLVLITLAVAVVVMLPAEAMGVHSRTNLTLLLLLATAANVLTAFWLRRRAGPGRWLGLRWASPRERWQPYALLLVIVPAEAALLSVQHLLHLPQWAAGQLLQGGAAHQPLLLLAFGGLAAPITEEVLFRGILLRGLLRNYRPAVAIAQSALLFGIMHFNPAQSLNALLLGLLLGWVYYKSQSLWLCIGLHSLHNALAIGSGMLPHVAGSAPAASILAHKLAYALVLTMAALLLALSLHALARSVAKPALEAAPV